MNTPARIIKENDFDAAFDRCISELNAMRSKFYSPEAWRGHESDLQAAENPLEELPKLAKSCFDLMATLIADADLALNTDHAVGFVGYMLEEMDNTFIDPMKAEITKEWEVL